MNSLLALVKGLFSHPANTVPAAVTQADQIGQGLALITAVVQSFPNGNTKTGVLNLLDQVDTEAAKAINAIHTAAAVGDAINQAA